MDQASSRGSVVFTSPPGDGLYTVWFGTNRQLLLGADGAVIGYSSSHDSRTHYGTCQVAISTSSDIDFPASPREKSNQPPSRQLKLLATQVLPEDAYWESVQTALRTIPTTVRDSAVLIHGDNVSFEDAAICAAQLSCDLGIPVMAFYSWPSQGTRQGDSADDLGIEANERFIVEFLGRMANRSGTACVHIVAYNTANNDPVRVIDRIASTAATTTDVPFTRIVLAAADVDHDTRAR